jgi:phage recombination protein Bet
MSTQPVEVPRRSVLVTMATKYNMEPAAFEATLRATVVPKNTSREQFAAFLVVANEYRLNPLTREIYAFPTSGGGIQPIVSIDGWLNLTNSHPACDGIEFDDHLDSDGKVASITARIWRKDRSKPTTVTEYLAECYRPTEPWKRWPRRMLRHKALIQAARYAFGFSGIVDPDEAERIGTNGMRDVTPKDDGPPPPPPARKAAPPTEADLVHELEAGLDDGQQIVWSEQVSLADEPQRATAEDVFDGAQFLKDVEGAYSVCEDMASLFEAHKTFVLPNLEQVFPPDRKRVKALWDEHYKRIEAQE